MDPASACPEEKAIALHCAAVEKYNRYDRKDRGSDAMFGILILRFAYSVGFILTFFMVPLFLGLLFKILNKTLNDNDNNSANKYGDNNSDAQLDMAMSSTDNDHYKPMFVAVSFVSFMYSFASITIAFYNLPNESRQPLNKFQVMKTVFLLVLLAWLIFFTIVYAIYYSSMDCMKKVLASAAVLSLGILAADIMLSIPPTILLLFVYPINSSALLALHIAIFYCATMVLAVYFSKIHKWMTKHYPITTKILKALRCLKGLEDGKNHPKSVLGVIYFCWCLHIVLGLVVLVALPITYICIMLLYQFVVARSNTSGVYLNGLPLYIPSVVIAVFGIVIKKGAFEQDTAEKEKKKEEQILIAQAQKIWTVIGHRLEDKNSSELISRMSVNELAKKLRTVKKDETTDSGNS